MNGWVHMRYAVCPNMHLGLKQTVLTRAAQWDGAAGSQNRQLHACKAPVAGLACWRLLMLTRQCTGLHSKAEPAHLSPPEHPFYLRLVSFLQSCYGSLTDQCMSSLTFMYMPLLHCRRLSDQ